MCKRRDRPHTGAVVSECQGMADGTLTLVESNLRTIVLFFNEEPVIPASLPHH